MQTCAAHSEGLGAICIPRRDPGFQEEAVTDPPHGPSSGQRSKGACLTGRLHPSSAPVLWVRDVERCTPELKPGVTVVAEANSPGEPFTFWSTGTDRSHAYFAVFPCEGFPVRPVLWLHWSEGVPGVL